MNLSLQQHQLSARIDCRSNSDRGLEEQPTIHEGYHARNLEAMGIPSTRCALNRQIKEDNRLLKELKVQVQKLTKALKGSIPTIASALESLRSRLETLKYHVLHDTSQQSAMSEVLDKAIPLVTEYSPLKFLQIRQFNQKIAALTEEIEELKSRKAYLFSCLECHSDSDMKAIQQKIEKMQEVRERLEGTFPSSFRNETLQKAEKIINSELQETESLHSILHRLHQKETALNKQSRTPKRHKDRER